MKPIHFLGILTLIVGYFAYKVFYPFLETIIIAVLLAIATYRINFYFLYKFKNKTLSATLSTFLIAVLFFAPIVYLITSAATTIAHLDIDQIKEIYQNVYAWINDYISNSKYLKNTNIIGYLEKIDLNAAVQKLVAIASFLAAKSAKFLKDIVLILIFYFFANLYGKDLLLYFQNIMPLTKEESSKLFESLANVMGVVFSSILATAFFEGVLFGIIAQIYGYDGLMFGILYGFASLVPVVGGIIMWLPLSIHQFALGNTSAAITIALYSIIVISIIADTFIKPIIIKYIDTLLVKKEIFINEILVFFAIVAGLASYGFWGMIIGPAVLTLLISILNLYPEISNNNQPKT